MSSEAFVTLATTDAYGLGAAVLAESIRKVGTKRNLVVLISNHLSDLIRQTLEISFDEVILVDELNSNDVEHLSLLSRPELGITFTKLNCWLLEQYSKCVFLDSDIVVLRPIDDLFEREEFSAAPDAGWPDCFNSGVFVYRPSKDTFNKLVLFASQQNASFDGGDQGLLNSYFSNWRTSDISRHLPFTYNVTANAFYSYLPAVTRFRNDIHVVHFAGALKPWQLTYNSQNEQLSGNLGGQSDIQREFFLSWWRIMHQRVWPHIDKLNQQSNSNKSSDGQNGNNISSNGSFNYGNLTTNYGIELGSVQHRRLWESGQIDYFGRDSFSNIQQQLERNIQSNNNSNHYHPAQQTQITHQQKPTSILKNSNKQSTTTTTTTQNEYLSKETTNNLPSSSSSVLQRQQPPPSTTNTVKNSLKETNGSQNLLKEERTALTNPIKSSLNNSTRLREEQQQQQQQQQSTIRKTNDSEKLLKEQTNSIKSSLKETTPIVEQTIVSVSQTVLQQTPSQLKSTNIQQNGSKQNQTNLQTQTQNNQLTNNSTTEHQSNWTVKSTIVTAFTPGVGEMSGPTVVTKSVSESSSTGTNNLPTKTINKQITDPTNASLSNVKANRSNHHFAWLFDKVFVGITYAISLCYFLFLVAIRRSKNTNTIHGNVSSVPSVTSSINNGKRVNK